MATTAMAAMRRKLELGGAAMRYSMYRLIETSKAHEVHPAYWPPSVVFGEGG
ncbi:MAG: hypothetical protein AAGD43_05185 [Pseudomonadota bacterium]